MTSDTAPVESPATDSSVTKASRKAAKKKAIAKKPVAKKSSAKKLPAKKTPGKQSSAKKKVAPVKRGKTPLRAKKAPAKPSEIEKPPASPVATPNSQPPQLTAEAPTPPSAPSKAQSIRDTAAELGKRARPRHIIAALAEKGITVSSPQVSMTLKAAKMREAGKAPKAATAAPRSTATGHGVNIDDLLKVKKLSEELGGAAKVKEALAALERLV